MLCSLHIYCLAFLLHFSFFNWISLHKFLIRRYFIQNVLRQLVSSMINILCLLFNLHTNLHMQTRTPPILPPFTALFKGNDDSVIQVLSWSLNDLVFNIKVKIIIQVHASHGTHDIWNPLLCFMKLKIICHLMNFEFYTCPRWHQSWCLNDKLKMSLPERNLVSEPFD